MAKVHAMQSMELDDETQYDSPILAPGMDKPRFPYGLKICLEDAQLEELGLDPGDCCVGGLIHLHAMARVTSVSQNDTDGGKKSRVELQIEDLCVEGEGRENEVSETQMESGRKQAKLYDRKKE